MNGDEGMDAPCEKLWKEGNPLSNTIKDTSTIMHNPLPELCREGLCMIVLVSLLRGFPCFHNLSHVASIPTTLFIQLNDFCTCSTFFDGLRTNTDTCMRMYIRRLVHGAY